MKGDGYRAFIHIHIELTVSFQTGKRVLVRTLCGEVIALAKTTDDLARAGLGKVCLNRLLCRLLFRSSLEPSTLLNPN